MVSPLSNQRGALIRKGQADRSTPWVASSSEFMLFCVAYRQGPGSNCITSHEWPLGMIPPDILVGPLCSVTGTARPGGTWDSHEQDSPNLHVDLPAMGFRRLPPGSGASQQVDKKRPLSSQSLLLPLIKLSRWSASVPCKGRGQR